MPYNANLKLLLNSDKEKYGGAGKISNRGTLKTKAVLKDVNPDRPYNVKINVPAMSTLIFSIEKEN